MTFASGILPNGFGVMTDYSPRHKTVAVHWAMRSGSREDILPGTAHFFEHIFSSAHVAPGGDEVMRRFDDVSSFGGCNFETTPDSIVGFAYVQPQYAAEIIGTMGRCVLHPSWTPEILERERAVIAEELVSQKDHPYSTCLWASTACAYPGHPAGRDNLGSRDNIAAMSEAHLLDYMNRNFHAQRMVLCVSGNLHHDDVMGLAAAAFGDLPRGTPAPAQERPEFHGGELVLFHEKKKKQQVMMSFAGPDAVHPLLRATGVMMRMFDGALELSLREKGLTYDSAESFCSPSRDSGEIVLTAASSSRKSAAILKEMHTLASAPEKWLTRQAFDRFTLKKETTRLQFGSTTSDRAGAMANNFLARGTLLSPDQIRQRVARVTFDDANAAWQNWNREVFNVVSYGPSRRIPGPDKILNPPRGRKHQLG
jgi:predicted Zn-dependent peptidase